MGLGVEGIDPERRFQIADGIVALALPAPGLAEGHGEAGGIGIEFAGGGGGGDGALGITEGEIGAGEAVRHREVARTGERLGLFVLERGRGQAAMGLEHAAEAGKAARPLLGDLLGVVFVLVPAFVRWALAAPGELERGRHKAWVVRSLRPRSQLFQSRWNSAKLSPVTAAMARASLAPDLR